VLAPLALDELISNALADAAAHASRRGIVLDGDAAPGITINADVRQVTRVLDNLVDNAIADTPAGGRVHVSAELRRDGVRLDVQDSCGGITESDLERLFEPGYRGDASRGTDRRGLGLGLAIARGLAEANGARIAVRNVDDGCRFTLHFPPSQSP
jgi:signal transduction histidine kinase